jgi:glutaredoxin-like YruB-family protein
MNKTITIYSTPTCHFCQMAKEFLKEQGIEYTEFDVAHDLERRQEMIQKSGQMGVPVIVVGDPSNPSGQDEIIVGFDKGKLAMALDKDAQEGIVG